MKKILLSLFLLTPLALKAQSNFNIEEFFNVEITETSTGKMIRDTNKGGFFLIDKNIFQIGPEQYYIYKHCTSQNEYCQYTYECFSPNKKDIVLVNVFKDEKNYIKTVSVYDKDVNKYYIRIDKEQQK